MANSIMISGNECEEPPILNMESVLTSTPVKVITFTSYIGHIQKARINVEFTSSHKNFLWIIL